MRTDGQTHMTKLTVAFRNFAKALKRGFSFLKWNQLDAPISQIYFWNKNPRVSDSSSVHQLASRIRTELHFRPDPASKLSAYLYDTYTIALCTVKNFWWWTEELSETCRVYTKNKVEKLVHLVGFIIGIYHDARLPERQVDSHNTMKTPLTLISWN